MKFSMGEHCLASFIKNVIDKFQHVCSCTVRLSGIIKQFGQVPTAISPPVNQTWVVQSESTALTGESQLLINYAENGCHKMHVTWNQSSYDLNTWGPSRHAWRTNSMQATKLSWLQSVMAWRRKSSIIPASQHNTISITALPSSHSSQILTRSSAVAEAARCFVSSNISLSHSRSSKMTLLSRAYVSPY